MWRAHRVSLFWVIGLRACLPASKCQGSAAEAIGLMVSGEAPQLDGTRMPFALPDAPWPERSAAFSGATLLNSTLDKQPTKPGVL